MSSRRIAPKVLEDIVDLLHDEKIVLRNCCLASKSWIQRTRKHLFADIEFHTKAHLQSWKDTFLDPATSPARYTKTLSINCPYHVTTEDVGWIRTFSSVRRFKMDSTLDFDIEDTHTSLMPFHAFSPTVESLHIVAQNIFALRIFNLALTFPLLHSLEVVDDADYDFDPEYDSDDGSLELPRPLNLPVLTGTLRISICGGLRLMAPMLLSLNGNLRVRRLDLVCCDIEDDPEWAEALLKGCLSTVESLRVYLSVTV